MIPIQARTWLARATGEVLRPEREAALRALRGLGVDPATEFGAFYLEYQGPFIGPRPGAELLDIAGPGIPAIPDQTDYARDRFRLPPAFLALTTDESEGMVLYNRDDGAVYDFDLGCYEAFMAGRVAPDWPSFGEFLAWYFDEAA